MKTFAYLWSSLLLMMLIVGYCAALTIFISEWFIILTLVCVICSVKLMSSAFLEAQLLKKRQKHELTISLHRFGYLFLLIAFGCVLYIAKNPAEQQIISTAIGIGCFCNYILSHSLRNVLGSWVQTLRGIESMCEFTKYVNKLAEIPSLVFCNKYFGYNYASALFNFSHDFSSIIFNFLARRLGSGIYDNSRFLLHLLPISESV